MSIKVLIADDHVFYREGVRTLLSNSAEVSLAGEASNGEEVIAKAAQLKPDVILMDLKMPASTASMPHARSTNQIPRLACW